MCEGTFNLTVTGFGKTAVEGALEQRAASSSSSSSCGGDAANASGGPAAAAPAAISLGEKLEAREKQGRAPGAVGLAASPPSIAAASPMAAATAASGGRGLAAPW